jgi:hypothetical protein
VSVEPRIPPAHGGEPGHDEQTDRPPPPGQGPIVLAGLSLGVVLMGIQLWLLTVALDLYLGGSGSQVWSIALISGLIFLGGLLMLWLLDRRPHGHSSPPGGFS